MTTDIEQAVAEADGWTAEAIWDHPTSALDTIRRLRRALEREHKRAERAEAALTGLAIATERGLPAIRAERDGYKAAIREALPMLGMFRAWNVTPEQIENLHRILSRALDAEKGDAS